MAQPEKARETKTEVVVVFRKWWRQSDGGGVIALFPYLAERDGMCLSYEHVGQHGAADYAGVVQRTIPARPEEYKELKRELEGRGYKLKVRTRKGGRHYGA